MNSLVYTHYECNLSKALAGCNHVSKPRQRTLGFGGDGHSVIAVLFAISITPMLMVRAIAIDLGEILVMKHRLGRVHAYIAASYPSLSVIGTL